MRTLQKFAESRKQPASGLRKNLNATKCWLRELKFGAWMIMRLINRQFKKVGYLMTTNVITF